MAIQGTQGNSGELGKLLGSLIINVGTTPNCICGQAAALITTKWPVGVALEKKKPEAREPEACSENKASHTWPYP